MPVFNLFTQGIYGNFNLDFTMTLYDCLILYYVNKIFIDYHCDFGMPGLLFTMLFDFYYCIDIFSKKQQNLLIYKWSGR